MAEYNGVRVEVKSNGLQIRNSTDQRLAVYAIDQAYEADNPVTKCADVTDLCLRILAHGDFFISFDDVPGYTPHLPIAVYTWTVSNGSILEVADMVLAQW